MKFRQVIIDGKQYREFTIVCAECDGDMQLRSSKYGVFYSCRRYPECRGSHGAHPDGKPLGTPGNSPTKQMRHSAHQVFDQLWRRGPDRVFSRGEAYVWMQKTVGIAHIGSMSIAECKKLIQAVWDFKDAKNSDQCEDTDAIGGGVGPSEEIG